MRASTSAIGTPNSTQSTVATDDVRRLSHSAVSADSEVISSTKLPQSTREHHRDQREQHERRAERRGDEDPGGEPDLPLLVVTP